MRLGLGGVWGSSGWAVGADLVEGGEWVAVGGGDTESEAPEGDRCEGMTAEPEVIVLDGGEGGGMSRVVVGDEFVIADGFGLGSANHLAGMAVAGGEGELALETGVERELDALECDGLGPFEVEPGLAVGEWGRPSVGPLAGEIANETVDGMDGSGLAVLLGGGDVGAAGEVVRVGVGEAFDGLVIAQEGLLEFGSAGGVVCDLVGEEAMTGAEGGGGAGGLAGDGAGGHDAGGGEGDVGGAEVAAGHEEILDVAAVEATEGDGIDLGEGDGGEGRFMGAIEAIGG
jgi:hypothetical protein